jgi:hypothetical protein
MEYVLPLSLIPTIASFIGYGFIGKRMLFWGVRYHSIEWGISKAIINFSSIVVGVYLTAFIISIFAANFGQKKDFNKVFALAGYSCIPLCLGGIFFIIPSLAVLAWLAGLYGVLLIYFGLKPIMNLPDETNKPYTIVTMIASLVTPVVVIQLIQVTLSVIMGLIFGGYGGYGFDYGLGHGHGLWY